MNDPLIHISKLCKVYLMGDSEVHALRDVSLDIHQGEYVSIMGPSGSGKSTLMNILGCLDTPTSGAYFFRGTDVSALDDDALSEMRNREIGFIFQNFNLLPKLTSLQNVELPLVYAGVGNRERRERAIEALRRVQLAERMEHTPGELSGGQRQRVAIARALVTRPGILLADEPTGALDSKTSVEIMQLFHELNAQGNTVIVITHDPGVASHARRCITIHDGAISSDASNPHTIIPFGK
jgi:putative ABC transport system ATP-binding protein